jgi:hypothetical protein
MLNSRTIEVVEANINQCLVESKKIIFPARDKTKGRGKL